MHSYGNRHCKQDYLNNKYVHQKESGVTNCRPKQKQCENLAFQGDSFSLSVVSYVVSKQSVVEQPTMHPFRAFVVACSREQEKRSSRQDRQKHTCRPQSQTNSPTKHEQPFLETACSTYHARLIHASGLCFLACLALLLRAQRAY